MMPMTLTPQQQHRDNPPPFVATLMTPMAVGLSSIIGEGEPWSNRRRMQMKRMNSNKSVVVAWDRRSRQRHVPSNQHTCVGELLFGAKLLLSTPIW